MSTDCTYFAKQNPNPSLGIDYKTHVQTPHQERLKLRPISFHDACQFVAKHHRHHKPPKFWLCGTSVVRGVEVVGVIMVMRPSSRALDDGVTAEVSRCCTDGTPNVASMLYGAAARASRALGYERVITYTLKTETGVSLRAAGWIALYDTRGGSWDTPSRHRIDKAPTSQKTLWEVAR